MQVLRRATPVLTLGACLGADVWSQSAAGEPQAYMRKIGFPDGEIADLNAGKVVARVIPERRPGPRTCGLVFDPDDLDDFSKCRPGSCEIQAPAQAMELAHQVNWNTTDQSRFYLVAAVRARIDPPRKLRGFLLGKIKGSMKDALATDVRATRQRLEAAPARSAALANSSGALSNSSLCSSEQK